MSGGAGFLPSTVAPEKMASQKETRLPTINFWGRTVSFREGIRALRIPRPPDGRKIPSRSNRIGSG